MCWASGSHEGTIGTPHHPCCRALGSAAFAGAPKGLLLCRGRARASCTLKPLGRALLPLLPQQHPWAAPNEEKGRVGELAKPMPRPSAREKNGYFVRMYFIKKKKKNKPLVFLLHPFVVPMIGPGLGVCSAFRHWGFVCTKQPCKLGGSLGPHDGLSAGSAFPCRAPGPLATSRGCYQGCHLSFLLRRAGWRRALAHCRPWRVTAHFGQY